jgi:hypothetical protein
VTASGNLRDDLGASQRDGLLPRDLHTWVAKPSAFMLIPHSVGDFASPVRVAQLKENYPSTYEYVSHFEKALRAHSGYKQLHKSRPEYWVVGNVGPYSKCPFKVAFKDLTEFFQCAVVGPLEINGRSVPVVPDHSVLHLNCEFAEDTYLFAGLLNSAPARVALHSSAVRVETQRYFATDISHLQLPWYDKTNRAHVDVLELSRECHALATTGATGDLGAAEAELTLAVGQIWGLTKSNLSQLSDAYRHLRELYGAKASDLSEDGDE